MGEEEKNSSRKPDAGPRPIRENAFTLHYFPEIPMNGSDSERSDPGRAAPFQRVSYTADGSCRAGGRGDPPLSNPELEAIETQAYIRGFNKGEKEGYASARNRIDKTLNQFSSALSEISRLRKQIYADTEAEIVELALSIARKIVGCEIETNPGLIAGVLTQALEKVETHQNVSVRINPKDLDFIKYSDLQVADTIESPEAIKIIEDPAISRGGCLVQTESGEIDARIEKQINVIEEAFREQLKPTME